MFIVHENYPFNFKCTAMFVCLQETAQQVFLVMEYCNGGDLADYLNGNCYFLYFYKIIYNIINIPLYIHNVTLDVFSNVFCFLAKGTLTEDTIQLFLRQLGKPFFLLFFIIFLLHLKSSFGQNFILWNQLNVYDIIVLAVQKLS